MHQGDIMKTIKYLLISIIILALLPQCSKEDSGNPEFHLKASDKLDEMDYRLYSLILDELFPETKNPVINQATSAFSASLGQEYLQTLKELYPEMDTTLFSEYCQVNDTVYYLENKFSVTSKKVTLISDEEIQFIFSTNDPNKGWEEFYRRYPDSGGTISFSRIGYNSVNTRAMVELGNMYASLGGEGRLIFLKLENNEWKIFLIILTWIS
jgi:hypothetical protein